MFKSKICSALGQSKEKNKINELNEESAHGNADAQCELGSLYQCGGVVEKNRPKASQLFTLAAEQGHAEAQCRLATMWHKGQVAEKTKEEKRKERDRAKELAKEGGYEFSTMPEADEEELTKYQRAARLYAKAADQGHAASQFMLGVMYTRGIGVEKDITTAMDNLELAASQGHHEKVLEFIKEEANGSLSAAFIRRKSLPGGLISNLEASPKPENIVPVKGHKHRPAVAART